MDRRILSFRAAQIKWLPMEIDEDVHRRSEAIYELLDIQGRSQERIAKIECHFRRGVVGYVALIVLVAYLGDGISRAVVTLLR